MRMSVATTGDDIEPSVSARHADAPTTRELQVLLMFLPLPGGASIRRPKPHNARIAQGRPIPERYDVDRRHRGIDDGLQRLKKDLESGYWQKDTTPSWTKRAWISDTGWSFLRADRKARQ